MNIVRITLIQMLALIIASFCALIDGDLFWSCFYGLYAIPMVLMLIHFTPKLMRGEHE